MFRYSTLETISIAQLYDVFKEAFQGFPIVSEATAITFGEMLSHNEYNPRLSLGAFTAETDKLVGFVLNRILFADNRKTAYAILTATRPKFRRQGIMTHIFRNTKELLCRKKVVLYETEVLKNNIPALTLYQSQGFTIVNEITTTLPAKTESRLVSQYKLALTLP